MTRAENVLGDNIGFIDLASFMGSDFTVAASARVSLRQETQSLYATLDEFEAKDKGLINRLMRDKHTSCFESVVFQFRIRAPIFVARQHFRHRWGSFNEESGRYVELKDECYVPQTYLVQVGKAMDYKRMELDPYTSGQFRQRELELLKQMRALYEDKLAAGIAREHARIHLPVSQYTTYLWTVNGLALMNFLWLRNSPHAQLEIRKYAEVIENWFKEYLPWTHEAFRKHWGVAMLEGVAIDED